MAVILLMSTLTPAARGDAHQGFAGIDFGMSVEDVRALVDGRCDHLQSIESDSPTLPLAAESETHLICTGYTSSEGSRIDGVAFSFGDGLLVSVEARGGAVEALVAAAGEKVFAFSGFDVYLATRTVSRPVDDTVWVLSEAALHPHLFLWSNPHLPSRDRSPAEYDGSATRPEVLSFGGSLEDLLPGLEDACPYLEEQVIDPPWLPTRPETQIQMNCYGIVYAGFPRKIEAVFGDERLQLAWILTGKGEEDRVRQALIAAFGEPIFVSEAVEAFDGWRVALRKDKPEVLMVIDELAPVFERQFSGSE